MPAENLPIQNINNSRVGFLFGSGNSTDTMYMSFAMGADCVSIHACSYAEGYKTSATGTQSHAEGSTTIASGEQAHAEGYKTSAIEHNTHAEGAETLASGNQAHAEGYGTSAFYEAHAEGCQTIASGENSHAEGLGTIAGGGGMHVGGRYNSISSNAAFVIGNGADNTHRSDAFIVDWDGGVSAASFTNSAGEIPALIPTATAPSPGTACSIYLGDDGKFYIVTGNL